MDASRARAEVERAVREVVAAHAVHAIAELPSPCIGVRLETLEGQRLAVHYWGSRCTCIAAIDGVDVAHAPFLAHTEEDERLIRGGEGLVETILALSGLARDRVMQLALQKLHEVCVSESHEFLVVDDSVDHSRSVAPQ